MMISLGYEPEEGSCRQPPNIALDEKSEQLPWSEEIKISNGSLVARLSAYQGPQTLPRKLMNDMKQRGMLPHFALSAQRFKRKASKKPRGRTIAVHKHSLKIRRAACSDLTPTSGARLYCELTPGKYLVVAHKGAQFCLERQGVGLVPLPKVGTQTCTPSLLCCAPSSVAHSAFECPAHSQPRKGVLETLDRAHLDF